jgi:rhodanese-related sulfurtransferase
MTESSAMSFAYGLPADVPVIVYSEDGVAGDRVAESLSSRGRPVTSLLGGLAEWQKVEGNFLLVASVP